MKITNSTDWNTKELRQLILATTKKEGQTKTKTVRVIYKKHSSNYEGYRDHIGGWAGVFGSNVLMTVPRLVEARRVVGLDGSSHQTIEAVEFPVKTFVQVLVHEFAHNRGLQHSDMRPSKDYDASWAKGFKVTQEIKSAKPKEKRNIILERYTLTVKRLKKKEQKLKRLQNTIKKLIKLKKYYEDKSVGGIN